MHITTSRTPMALAAACAALLWAHPAALAQVAGGSTTVGISVSEVTQVAAGWSVKKTLLGKAVFNETGQQIGEVEDLIVDPARKVSFVIVGVGGIIGFGRHDVAVPVGQIQDRAGRLVMNGASESSLKALPPFVYADDTTLRERFVAGAEHDIARSRIKLTQMEEAARTATTEAKAQTDLQIAALQVDLKAAEARLGELKLAAVQRWHEFEGGVSAATARLRKSLDGAAS